MIFRSKLVSAQWDTWCYFHGGAYYLYYLITDGSPGEGFGVATSSDGVHWTDHGWAIRESEKKVQYLGTGSVWPDPVRQGAFICNYSEHRLDETGKPRQCILFARSEDLVHWEKCGDEHIFWIDEQYYERYGRWDCIYAIPRRGGGYFGTWTATPKGRERLSGGIGFGVSMDGIKWEAVAPMAVTPDADESGAIVEAGGRVHAMFGSFGKTTESGMHAYVAEAPDRRYTIAEKNAHLLRSEHAYFSRFFLGRAEDGVLVNHHAMDGTQNQRKRRITYAAPFKRFVVDAQGVQRWMWWQGNEALKGPAVPADGALDFQRGAVIEGRLGPGEDGGRAELHIAADDLRFIVRLSARGEMTVAKPDPQGGAEVELQKTDRQLTPTGGRFRLLARRSMLEAYLDDHFLESCALGCPDARRIRVTTAMCADGQAAASLRAWQMSLEG